jgi:hypothetical protein
LKEGKGRCRETADAEVRRITSSRKPVETEENLPSYAELSQGWRSRSERWN